MSDRHWSYTEPGPFPEEQARLVERNVGVDGEWGELDRQREALRLVVLGHAARVMEAAADLSHACVDNDDHLAVEHLRRLLALGLLCKSYADQIEGLLPQPTRLFAPEA